MGTSFDSPAMGKVECLVWITEGLAAFGQKEVIFSLSSTQGGFQKQHLEAVNGLFVAILQQAKQGHLVDIGGRTIIGASTGTRGGPGWLEGSAITGVTYTRGIVVPGVVQAPERYLLAVGLTKEEIEVADRAGQGRILGQLTAASRYFPVPPWTNPSRAPIERAILRGKSIVDLFDAREYMPQSSATISIRDGQLGLVELRLARADLLRFGQIGFRTSTLLLPGMAPHADGILVWVPGNDAPTVAAVRTPTFVAAAMVVISPDGITDEVTFVDDAVLITLSRQTMTRLVAAVKAHEIPWNLDVNGQTVLRVMMDPAPASGHIDGP